MIDTMNQSNQLYSALFAFFAFFAFFALGVCLYKKENELSYLSDKLSFAPTPHHPYKYMHAAPPPVPLPVHPPIRPHHEEKTPNESRVMTKLSSDTPCARALSTYC